MKSLQCSLVRGLICFSALSVYAATSIEGTVTLPKANKAAANVARYKNVNASDVGPPSPAVAVVYLEGNFTAAAPTNISAKVVQQRFQFLPATLAIQTGTTVEFPNLDETYHNVFSYSKAKRFDLGRYRKDEKPATVTFDQAGVIKLYCEIHEHMRATILVLDTPHFTSTDTNGGFRLEHLPAGKFVLKAWVDDKTQLKRDVELTEGATLHVDFSNR